MLIVKGLTKNYGALQILKGIDLTVYEGEIVSIVGSSGAGKTTLLQILGTLDRPDKGTFSLSGIEPFSLDANGLAKFRNQNIGFVFQFHQLLPEFDACENIMIPAMIKGIQKKKPNSRPWKCYKRLDLNRVQNTVPTSFQEVNNKESRCVGH